MKKAPLLPVECIFGFKFFQDSYAHITDFVSWQIQMGPSGLVEFRGVDVSSMVTKTIEITIWLIGSYVSAFCTRLVASRA